MVKIGNITLKNGLILAPMAGVTDYAYRTICRMHGAEAVVSEMISAKAIHYRDKKTKLLARITPDEKPMAIQLFGSEKEIMAEAAKLLEDMPEPPSYIDINMGCPVHKIVSNGEGSALMREPSKAAEIVYAVSRAIKLPVTVKMRTGWDDNSINAPELARAVEQSGAAAICVHARTRAGMYGPDLDYETAARVKQAVSVPVFANGSINSAADAIRVLRDTGCDGLMLARGTMGNPWLFEEIASALSGEPYAPPSLRDRFDTIRRHVELLFEDKGEYTASREARRQMSYYFKGMPGSAGMRNALSSIESRAELDALIASYESSIEDFEK